jgi:threonine/homoserine/homoserine lactone efflux protein
MSIFILQGIALGFTAVVQPGPFMAYLLSQTLAHGFRKTWMAAFAPLISDGPIIVLALLILTQMPAWLQRGLNLASGVFILYLAWGAYQQWRNYAAFDGGAAPTGRQSVLKAAMMNALSPMPYIYWSLVTGPILMAGWRENPAHGLGFLAAFYIVIVCGLLVMMAVFSVARTFGNLVSRWLLGISVLALAGFGLFQLWRGLLG